MVTQSIFQQVGPSISCGAVPANSITKHRPDVSKLPHINSIYSSWKFLYYFVPAIKSDHTQSKSTNGDISSIHFNLSNI